MRDEGNRGFDREHRPPWQIVIPGLLSLCCGCGCALSLAQSRPKARFVEAPLLLSQNVIIVTTSKDRTALSSAPLLLQMSHNFCFWPHINASDSINRWVRLDAGNRQINYREIVMSSLTSLLNIVN